MSVSALSLDVQHPNVRRRIAAVVAILLAFVVSTTDSGIAHAHTGFESSTPADGAETDEPVSLVTIVFTGEANPVGDKFVALTPDGVLHEPISIETLDNMVFAVRFDPPLAGGQVGLRWNVQAADAHPIEGAFSFAVNAPAPTVAPPTTNESVEPAAQTPSTSEEVAVSTVGASDQAAPPSAVDTTPAASASPVTSTQSLDEFLTVDNSTPGQTTVTIGHLIGFLGVALGLGALAFVATALRGRSGEVRRMLTAVRVLGVVIAIGAAVEYVGVTRIAGDSLASGWTTAPAAAALLRIAGGIGLVAGLAGSISHAGVGRGIRRPPAARPLSAAVVEDHGTDTATRRDESSPIVRWTPDARSWPAFGGVVLIIVSFWFDGHTVSKGFRPLHALVNSVHVAAGAVWVGGVVAMSAVIWTRRRTGEPMRVVELVVRFSKIATIALASVVAAGVAMAILVLDSFGELTGTPWGKMLLLKTAAVGLAMIGGAYNHFRLLPALESNPESPELIAELRSTVTAEAVMLVFVVIVTAWLVSASS